VRISPRATLRYTRARLRNDNGARATLPYTRAPRQRGTDHPHDGGDIRSMNRAACARADKSEPLSHYTVGSGFGDSQGKRLICLLVRRVDQRDR
jgi:hypothetical protein